MKFNCGLSREEHNKLYVEKYSAWHDYFAWFPIRVGKNDCRWLEVVERKGEFMYGQYKFALWSYRAKEITDE